MMHFLFHNRKNPPADPEPDWTLRVQQGKTAERRLETILNTLSEGVLVMDEKLTLQLVNPKARSLFDMDQSWEGLSLLAATRSTELEAAAYQVLKGRKPVDLELKRYTAGVQHYFQVSTAPLIRAEEGTPLEGLVMVFTEITRLHKLEQVRKDFAANVSHELRTPIQVVKGFAETLLDSSLEDPPQIRHCLRIMLKNAQTMEHLTTDLLSLVSLEEGGHVPFALQETLVYPLLQEALASVEESAQKKRITLFLDCPGDLQAVLYGPFILQGVINLLDNGINYSPPGSRIWIQGALEAGQFLITVQDEGIGIPAKHLERIFERFYRVDPARSRAQGGTGLGLAIVRHIALIHQGVAEAESHAGEGSIFRIRIPQNSNE